jgi:hypothetical protein
MLRVVEIDNANCSLRFLSCFVSESLRVMSIAGHTTGLEELCPMVLHKRLSGYAALAILAGLLGACTSSAYAASVVKQKRAVPGAILKGSALLKGRAFYRTSMPENSLAGIKLGRKASEVLLKWGNPTRITLSGGQAAQPAAAAGGPGMMPGMGGGAMMPGMGGGAMMPGMGSGAMPGMGGGAMPGMGGGAMPGMAGGGPGMPGMGMGMGMGAGAGAGAPAAASSNLSSNEVVWTYDLTNGITIEFVISENVVTQITVGGIGPWGPSRTAMGLQLGDTYKLVIWVAGYPESQEFSGRFLRLSYVTRCRVLYTFEKNKCVGVTIALDPNNVR